ncbi:FHA domain-containing protein [Candidatus Synechococcus calcipolaris G9]|uniref:non-specific serine/threonine protein kinase n=1 Tax=Candidatus Synechococcus calcipolaris G9 TaxID=1497997 RepID=A0ABT6EWY1_9SYNE|nr:FHA domain-containing protein [Candidatus Synechococcus calcipolaris]MDG2990284.1 FHA domain-containing protein [Candidatus Synechococcus calcipolaris G9]
MITLTLLHPVQATPVQSWTFETDPVIRIGRAVDNHVVLYSAVVSRHHVELRRSGVHWDVVNLGTNGTYLDGKRVQQAPLSDGGILRLARSGPNIQIRLAAVDQPPPPNARMETIPEQTPADNASKATHIASATDIEDGDKEEGASSPREVKSAAQGDKASSSDDEEDDEVEAFALTGDLPQEFLGKNRAPPDSSCTHSRAETGDIFCIECGYPLRVWKQIGSYHAIKSMGQNNTFLAWRNGISLVLKSHGLMPSRRDARQFCRQFQQLSQLSHACLPKIWEGFMVGKQPYVAMEMVYGRNLKKLVSEEGPLSINQVARWLLPVCTLLEKLHQQNPPIVHQHIRPSNLIHPYAERADTGLVLVGWGKAMVLTSESGTFIGTVGYTAPEQQEGHPQPTSDLYALGATLVYLLTGYEPETYYRWGAKEYRLYAEDIPHLDPRMVHLINTLTHPNPQERHSTARVVKEKLERFLATATSVQGLSSQ